MSRAVTVQWERVYHGLTTTTTSVGKRHILNGDRTRCGVRVPNDAKTSREPADCGSCLKVVRVHMRPSIKIGPSRSVSIADDGRICIYWHSMPWTMDSASAKKAAEAILTLLGGDDARK